MGKLEEDNKALAHEFLAALSRADVDWVAENYAEDMRLWTAGSLPFSGTSTKEEAIASGLASAEKFRGLDGLHTKYYLTGENGGGGVYGWESRQKAEAFYDDDWWPMMENAFGVRPTLTFYDNYVVVDNEAAEVRVEGKKADSAAA